MKQKISSILIFVLIMLTACSCAPQNTSESSNLSTPASFPTAEATDKPAEPAETPVTPAETSAVQEGFISDEFITNGLDRVQADPGMFGAFFADYKAENHLGIVKPEDFRAFHTGTLFNVNLPANVQPTDSDKVMISYTQFGDYDTIEENSGILLDVMAQLPEEKIPDSLLSYDKFIEIIASPNLVSTQGELSIIQWEIQVSCLYTDTGKTFFDFFTGSRPQGLVTYHKDDKYIDGSFPILDAVNCALKYANNEIEMTVSSDNLLDGQLFPQHGMFGEQKDGDVPTCSMPLLVEFAPADTVSFAILMTDPDSVPLAGYEWVHWMVVNLETVDLPENASKLRAAQMIQGTNDFGTIGYGGPTPPDKTHTYVITAYALDTMLDLQNGFTKEAFDAAIKGHILAEASMTCEYPNLNEDFF
ncbi:MAG: YbhB/YbcL family Raf kinase inhibitor-like protein [Clostridiaceae bacterium]|nr:YbhB/YbcL family Raf kinase inhibitor-like protein [Clostridiaceae bacterium]